MGTRSSSSSESHSSIGSVTTREETEWETSGPSGLLTWGGESVERPALLEPNRTPPGRLLMLNSPLGVACLHLANLNNRADIASSFFERMTQRLCRAVVSLLGQNPGSYTLEGTNIYLVGDGDRRILIDCGEGVPAFVPILRECLARERCAVETILLTHHHWDHIGGLDQVLDALRDQERAPRVFKVPHDETDVRIPETFPRVEPLRHGDVFEVPGATLETIRTPGHTSDSCSFWLREERCLFVGDCVLGRGSSVFTDLNSYEASLHRLAACGPRRLFCGHGPVVGEEEAADAGVKKLQEYIAHRRERTLQVWNGLHEVGSGGGSEEAIARAVYSDTDVPESLWPAAVRAVRQTLQALESRGAVRFSSEEGWVPLMRTLPAAPADNQG